MKLASALERMVADRGLRARLARRALEDVQSHSLERQAARVYEVYRKVAGRR